MNLNFLNHFPKRAKIHEEYFTAIKDFSFVLPASHSQKNENQAKNRYGNIFPFDASRVVLLPNPIHLHSEENTKQGKSSIVNDYINANYVKFNNPVTSSSSSSSVASASLIRGCVNPNISGKKQQQGHDQTLNISGVPDFICAQGPLEETGGDFWRMCVQHDVRVILMLTNLVEKGRNKCHQYWPGKVNNAPCEGRSRIHKSSGDPKELDELVFPFEGGSIRVRMAREVMGKDYITRDFIVETDCTGGGGGLEGGKDGSFNGHKGEGVDDDGTGKGSSRAYSGKQIHCVTQLHYHQWPDFGVPNSAAPVLNLLAVMKMRNGISSEAYMKKYGIATAGQDSGVTKKAVLSYSTQDSVKLIVGDRLISDSKNTGAESLGGSGKQASSLLGCCGEESVNAIAPDPTSAKTDQVIKVKEPSTCTHHGDQQAYPPIVVHCSAGVGRTGTLIAIYTALCRAGELMGESFGGSKYGSVKNRGVSMIDIPSIVNYMRSVRVGMIQTPEQYEFVYQSLREGLEVFIAHAHKESAQNDSANNSLAIPNKKDTQLVSPTLKRKKK
eukprot:Nk52_evm24s147 gene=Nk52_evmTU24s147